MSKRLPQRPVPQLFAGPAPIGGGEAIRFIQTIVNRFKAQNSPLGKPGGINRRGRCSGAHAEIISVGFLHIKYASDSFLSNWRAGKKASEKHRL
jgi:hypothetical protein